MLRLVPFAHVRADFSFGELAHGAAQQLLLFGGTEVHRWLNFTILDAHEALPMMDSAIHQRQPTAATRCW